MRSWASEASRTISITRPIHERTGSGGPELLRSSSRALELVLAQREQQVGRVLLARRRDLRLDLRARGLAGGEGGEPQPQSLGSELGGVVHGAVLARVLGVGLHDA